MNFTISMNENGITINEELLKKVKKIRDKKVRVYLSLLMSSQ